MTEPNQAREMSIAILPKFSALFSIFGSGFIIYDIVCSHFNVPKTFWKKKKNDISSSDGFRSRSTSLASTRGRSSRRFAQRKTLKNSAYYRLMLAMSSTDFIVSFAWFCTTWPIPKDDELEYQNPSVSVYGNIGTVQSCEVQAFFIQLGIITPFYNALLALYYYLTIRCEWKEDDFKCKVEYAGHAVSISWGLGTSIAGLVMELYNNSTVWCWIAPYPAGCGDGVTNGVQQPQCVRGRDHFSLRWVFYYGPLWGMIFLVALFMSLVYFYVRGLDNKMDQYTATYRNNASRAMDDTGSGELGPSGGGRRRSLMARTFSTMNTDTINEQRRQRRNERSRAVANQGLFYAGTFALVWVFGTIVRAMDLAGVKAPWIIIFWFAVFTPSQGFFNFLVYVRPRLLKWLEKRKKKREGPRNSKTGSSFNSEILHVSGVSGVSSSNEVTGQNQDRDASTRSDFDSEPFTKSKSEDSLDRNKKIRFASSDSDTDEPKVRFASSDDDVITKKEVYANPANSESRIRKVNAARGIRASCESTDVDVSDVFDADSDSEATIEPELLSSTDAEQEAEKEQVLASKKRGKEMFNATIDLATGEVRTRLARRRNSPPP